MKKVAWLMLLLVVIALFLMMPGQSSAQSSSSSDNYQIEEGFLGSGSNLESNSDNYGTAPGQQSVGGIGGGEGSSSNFRTQGGPESTNDPSLTCTVENSTVNLGALSPSTAATGTASFKVLNYTAYGYMVYLTGNTPTQGSHSLTALSSGGTSSPGTEQFGANVVENTSPVVGADPVQIPDNTFSFGEAAPNYGTPNTFRYVSGEAIALSNESTGITEYTLSYLANISNTTPGGDYSTDQEIICVGTY